MFLGFDIGNTSTVLGIYDEDSLSPCQTLRYDTVKDASAEQLHEVLVPLLRESGLDMEESVFGGMAFSSVVPELNGAYHALGSDRFALEALAIEARSCFSFPINYECPENLGIDRLVNVEAALHEYGTGSVVVDLGTAITFDVLTHNGEFDGGIIAPGIGTSIESLAERTSKLPRVDFEKPESIVGRNTVDALKSGFFHGWLSMIEGVIVRLERHYGETFRVVLTGGFASAIESEIHVGGELIVDPVLTMKGIRLVYNNSVEGI